MRVSFQIIECLKYSIRVFFKKEQYVFQNIFVEKYVLENIKRFFNKPYRKDYETIFPSGYYRSKILHDLDKSNSIQFEKRDYFKTLNTLNYVL